MVIAGAFKSLLLKKKKKKVLPVPHLRRSFIGLENWEISSTERRLARMLIGNAVPCKDRCSCVAFSHFVMLQLLTFIHSDRKSVV